MNTKSIAIITLRLITIYLLFQLVGTLSATLYSFVSGDSQSIDLSKSVLVILGVYVVSLFVLFRWAEPLGIQISKGLPTTPMQGQLQRTDTLALVLAGVAAFVFLSEVTVIINRFQGLAAYYQNSTSDGFFPKQKINTLILGFLGSVAKVTVAALTFLKAGKIAVFWDRLQPIRRNGESGMSEDNKSAAEPQIKRQAARAGRSKRRAARRGTTSNRRNRS